jgi:hypothetical protein
MTEVEKLKEFLIVYPCVGLPIFTIGVGIIVAHVHRTRRWLSVTGTVVELHDRGACLPNAQFIHWVVYAATLRYPDPRAPARSLEFMDRFWTRTFYTGLRQQVVLYVNPRWPEQGYVAHTKERLLIAAGCLLLGSMFLVGWAVTYALLLRHEMA